MADDDSDRIYWDGESYQFPDDFTFREQREVFKLVKGLLEPDEPVGDMDMFPAIATVVARRTDPAYTIEQALDLKPSDLKAPEAPDPPTKSARE